MKGNNMNCQRTIEGNDCYGKIEKFCRQYLSIETKEIYSVSYFKCVRCRRVPLKDQRDILGLNEKGEIQ